MNVEEIREVCIDSANKYHKYLEDNNKGLQVVDVNEIEYLPSKELVIKLRLSAKLFDVDAIFFQLLKNNKKYSPNEIKITEYDIDKNTIYVKVPQVYSNDFKNLSSFDIKVISDLKFLVTRVKEWYESNGGGIKFPSIVSSISESYNKIDFVHSKRPSDNQKESLKSIFTNPFSYVWGAPGTGKTQFVLAYAALNYLKYGEKIAIIAPTNNAIEQVLRGVIKITDAANISRKKILRLGTPSRKFADEFPEVCEERGIQKRLEEINKQITILKNLNIHKDMISQNSILIDYLVESHEVQKQIKELEPIRTNYDNLNTKFNLSKALIIKLDYSYNILKQRKSNLEKEINSFSSKFYKFFSSKQTQEELSLIHIEAEIVENRKKHQEEINSKEFIDLNSLLFLKEEKERMLSSLINKIKLKFSIVEYTNEIVKNLNESNFEVIQKNLSDILENKKDELLEQSLLSNDYSMYSDSEIQTKISEYQEMYEKLENFTTSIRLQTVNIIACTLDAYIGRFLEDKIKVKHIFLDEAGYANIIKALTLFNNETPITFLGDHMQLPPVCEINDKDMQLKEGLSNTFLWSQSAINIENIFNVDINKCLELYLRNVSPSFQLLNNTSLNSTFRFGINLSKVLDKHVYKNGFTSSNHNGETSIFYKHAPKSEELKSRTSQNEVNLISVITKKLDKKGIDYVILTPYTKQVKILGQKLPTLRNELRILTVHGSQGKEWNTVILSVADTSDMWFVDSTNTISKGLNLVNTAVSRAEKNLIIVCDVEYWQNQSKQLICDLLKVGQELDLS